jgi:serine/threonine protein kinase/tetratricopeptide (TPR) repeat protein
LIGHTISHYRILEKIGAGGMGEVYRAHDEQLDRDVALKVLPAGMLENEAARKQFRKEALALAKLNHPNIETVFEFSTDNGVDFLSMELIPGRTLSEEIKTGPMTEKEAVRLGVQLAEGLAAAHDQGVIHRDLKPANLFLTPDGRLKILDFGLARFFHPELSADVTQTTSAESGTFSGTLPYMSPEQLRGLPADPRSDIYAAGAILYEMATGRRPFPQGRNTELIGAILHRPAPPPRELNPQLSPAMEGVISKSIEKEATQRYQTARELRAALETVASASATSINIPKTRERGLRRGIAIASGAVLLVILCLGLLFGLNFRGIRDRFFLHRSKAVADPIKPAVTIKPRRSVAVLGFKNLSGRPEEAWLSTALSEMLTTELAAGERLRTVPGENVALMKINLSLPDADSYGQETLAQIHKNLNADDVVTGAYIRLNKDQMRLDLRLQDAVAGETLATVSEKGSEEQIDDLVSRAGSALREKMGVGAVTDAEATAVRAAVPSNPDAARLYAEGLAKLRTYDVLGAKDLLVKAVAAEPNSATAHAALARAWLGLGYDEEAKKEGKLAFDLSKNLGLEDRLSIEAQYRDSLHEWDHAIEIYRTLSGSFPDNLDYGVRLVRAQVFGGKLQDALATVETLRSLPPPTRDDPQIDLAEGMAAGFLGDFKRQQESAVRAVEKGKAQGAKTLVGRALLNECQALANLEQVNQAMAPCQEAVRIYAEAGDLVDSGRALIYYGIELDEAGDAVNARAKDEQALGIFRKAGFKRGVSDALNDIAIIQEEQGDIRGAISSWAEAQRINDETGNTLSKSAILGNTGSSLRKLGRLSEAREAFEGALAIDRKNGNKNNQKIWYEDYSTLLYVQGDLGGSKKLLDKMEALLRESPNTGHTASLLSAQGRIFFAEGDLTAAKAKYQQAIDFNKQAGNSDSVAADQVELGKIAMEEGHAAEAESPCREAVDVFQKARNSDSAVWAGSVLATAFLAEGKVGDAQKQTDSFVAYLSKSQNNETNLSAAIVIARVQAVTGRTSEALKNLEVASAEAHKLGFIPIEFESRLALGEIEWKSGKVAASRATLGALEHDAAARGFLLIARKAHAASQ